MVDKPSSSNDGDRRVNEIITAYLEAVDAGQAPDRQDWLRRYPEFAAELEAFLADYERVDRMAEPLRPAAAPVAPVPPERLVPGEAVTLDSAQPADVGAATTVRYFGDYELLEEIGRGGMGVVYKARQVSLNRVVALKMILAGQLASEDDVKRFHTEAEAAAQLDHPGIVPIFEVGQHEGQHYFSMGYVEGQSLTAKVARGPLEAREAAALVRTVAEAVHYAHEKGVIHRDLKPANILLDQSGDPRITDFGLAKRVEGDGSGLTATGQVLGTPSFMPPEQAAAKLNQIHPAADIYALGAILYCLLTGRPPSQAANPLDTLRQVLEQEPVAPGQLNPNLPRDLETITLKCLEKDQKRRYATAEELIDELGHYLAGEPIQARPVSRPERLWRWCNRKPVVAALIAAVTVSLIAGTIISGYFAVEANRWAANEARQRELAEGREKEALDAKNAEAAARNKETRQRLVAEQQTRVNRAISLAEQSRDALNANSEQSLLLAMEAIEMTQRHGEPATPAAEQALCNALQSVGGFFLRRIASRAIRGRIAPCCSAPTRNSLPASSIRRSHWPD